MKVKLELTKDFEGLKKGDVIERSRDIANLHLNKFKNAKIYVKKATKSKVKSK